MHSFLVCVPFSLGSDRSIDVWVTHFHARDCSREEDDDGEEEEEEEEEKEEKEENEDNDDKEEDEEEEAKDETREGGIPGRECVVVRSRCCVPQISLEGHRTGRV